MDKQIKLVSESDNETEVKQAMILDSKNNEGHEVSTLDNLEHKT
jgi:hypothetical protein